MLFNTYSPATTSENLVTARAVRSYKTVSNFCGKLNPRFSDFLKYRLSVTPINWYNEEPEDFQYWCEELKAEWAAIKEAVKNAGQPLQHQNVVYFLVFENGVKCGETNNLVQRYCNLNRKSAIQQMWYFPVNSKKEAQAAEHALHILFGRAHGMSLQRNKKDYYNCDKNYAINFIKMNKRKMYDAILAAIEEVREEE